MPRPPPASTTAGAGPWASLTRRDLEVLHHLAAGRSTAAIAAAMSVSTNTVRTRIHRLQNKLGGLGRDQVVPRARTLGLLPEVELPGRVPAVPSPRQPRTDSDPISPLASQLGSRNAQPNSHQRQ